jgi:hypothetical protein
MFDFGQEMQPGMVHSVCVRSMDISVFFGNSTARRAFAALALAALAVLVFRPVCDAYELAYHRGESAELCCSALDANMPVPPAKSVFSAGDQRGAPHLGILAALIPNAVPHLVHWLRAGDSLPLAFGSYPRRSARLLR